MYVLAQDIFDLMAYHLQTQLNLVKVPPSSIGIGNKFIKPKFNEIIIINHKVLSNLFARSPESSQYE